MRNQPILEYCIKITILFYYVWAKNVYSLGLANLARRLANLASLMKTVTCQMFKCTWRMRNWQLGMGNATLALRKESEVWSDVVFRKINAVWTRWNQARCKVANGKNIKKNNWFKIGGIRHMKKVLSCLALIILCIFTSKLYVSAEFCWASAWDYKW